MKYRRDIYHKKMLCKFGRRPPSAGLTPLAARSCGVAARRADFAIAKSGLIKINVKDVFYALVFALKDY